MEVTKSYARELEKQKNRKKALEKICLGATLGVEQIVFEPGCGHGHWLTNYAETHPEKTCIGIDLISARIQRGLNKRNKRSLQQLHFIKAELSEFLEVLPPHVRFEMTVMLFPDPWPKKRHHKRRMVQPELLDKIAERTKAGGLFCFRSDDVSYCDWAHEHLEANPKWEIDTELDWPHEIETYFQGLMEQYESIIASRVGSESC